MNYQDAVNCHNLKKSYDGIFAVNDASFTLSTGQFMALLGPSGCGKTTTLRLIAGLDQLDSGEIFLAGQPVSGRGIFVPPNRRNVGMVFQEYALFPHMSIEQNIAYSLARGSHRRVSEMLELVGLVGLEKRFPAQLSGGQQQRVALARALAPNPHTILLDEPFSNLDAGLRVQLREEVRRIIADAGVSAILVTHDQDEAMSMADQLGVMLRGRIAQTGTPRMLYDDPVSPEVTLFLGEANQIPGNTDGDSVETPLGRLPLRHSCQGAVEVFIRP
ncbi:MAG TPA: ABC transporter ATP-binding protein, partial [Aggregatilineales bacterium]|nr:ABC transporter ATP-binding protein [Aggregatilineales bacterium]